MQFENLARKTIENECEDYYFGFADLSKAQKSETEKYGSLLDEYPNSISIGLTMFPLVSKGYDSKEYEIKYRNAKNATDNKLDIITDGLSEILHKNGYSAFAVPKIETNENLFMYLHKMAVRMAGFNGILKQSAITPLKNGGFVNWSTLLTNAPLKM